MNITNENGDVVSVSDSTLAKMTLDWQNNFLTLSTFAEHYEITEESALKVLFEGSKIADKNVKNCKKIYKMSGYIWDYNLLDVSNIDDIYKGLEKRNATKKDYEKVDDLIAPLLNEIIKY